MKYLDGSPIALGDIVSIPVPSGTARARVVMLGETYEHMEIDPDFLAWVEGTRKLEASDIIVEWVDANPYSHNDSRYAPVGNYMFSSVDEHVQRVARRQEVPN